MCLSGCGRALLQLAILVGFFQCVHYVYNLRCLYAADSYHDLCVDPIGFLRRLWLICRQCNLISFREILWFLVVIWRFGCYCTNIIGLPATRKIPGIRGHWRSMWLSCHSLSPVRAPASKCDVALAPHIFLMWKMGHKEYFNGCTYFSWEACLWCWIRLLVAFEVQSSPMSWCIFDGLPRFSYCSSLGFHCPEISCHLHGCVIIF